MLKIDKLGTSMAVMFVISLAVNGIIYWPRYLRY